MATLPRVLRHQSLSLETTPNMKNRTLLTAALAALLSLPLALSAADEAKKKGGGFESMDANKDGKLSKEEFTKNQKDPAKAESRFAQLDTNKDGFLSKEEVAAGQKKKEGSK
jgi:hypothetical protein